VCQPILPTPTRTAAGLMCRRRMLSCHRGFPLRFAHTQSQGSRCRLRCQCALRASARLGSTGRGRREASVFVSPTRPWTTLLLTSSVRSSQLKSPQASAATGVPLEDTRARRSHLAGSLLSPTLKGSYVISLDLSGPASSPFMTDMETRPHCVACSITAKPAAHHLPPFTCGDGLQISLKILKIVLCSDFLGFHVIHHFPE
jgi:hypothetical protein